MGSGSSGSSSDAKVDAKPDKKTSVQISLRLRNKKGLSSNRARRMAAEVEESKKLSAQPKPPGPSQSKVTQAEEDDQSSLSDVTPISEQVTKLLSSNITLELPESDATPWRDDEDEFLIKKIAWWLLKNEKNPPCKTLIHPELHDDFYPAVRPHELDYFSEDCLLESVSNPGGLAVSPDRKKIKDPRWLDEYCGEASLKSDVRLDEVMPFEVYSMEGVRPFLKVKRGTGYDKRKFEVKCLVCDEVVKGQRNFGTHMRSHDHKTNFRHLSFAKAAYEEKCEKVLPKKHFTAKLAEYTVEYTLSCSAPKKTKSGVPSQMELPRTSGRKRNRQNPKPTLASMSSSPLNEPEVQVPKRSSEQLEMAEEEDYQSELLSIGSTFVKVPVANRKKARLDVEETSDNRRKTDMEEKEKSIKLLEAKLLDSEMALEKEKKARKEEVAELQEKNQVLEERIAELETFGKANASTELDRTAYLEVIEEALKGGVFSFVRILFIKCGAKLGLTLNDSAADCARLLRNHILLRSSDIPTDEVEQERIPVLKLICQAIPKCLEVKDDDETLLFAEWIHPLLLKELIVLSGDAIYEQDCDGNTFLQKILDTNYDRDEFLEYLSIIKEIPGERLKRLVSFTKSFSTAPSALIKKHGPSIINDEVIGWFVTMGAKLDVSGKRPILLLGIKWRLKTEELALLIKYGSNIRWVDSRKKTLLHHAADFGCSDSIAVLLKAGVDVNAKDVVGMTALDYCRKRARRDPNEYWTVEMVKKGGGKLGSEIKP